MRDEDGNYYEDDLPRGCLLATVLSLIIWAAIVGWAWWLFRYGIDID